METTPKSTDTVDPAVESALDSSSKSSTDDQTHSVDDLTLKLESNTKSNQPDDLSEKHALDESEKKLALHRPQLKELLQSSDTPSRYVTLLSLVFGALALISAALLVAVMVTKNKKIEPVAHDDPNKVKLEPLIQESLGHYQIVLKPTAQENETGATAEKNQDLRVDLVAECSSIEACKLLKAQMPQARDLIIPVLSSATREDLLKSDTKNIIKQRIAEQLNGLVEPGQINQVHMSDLTIETGK